MQMKLFIDLLEVVVTFWATFFHLVNDLAKFAQFP